jgi:hypothetical protein
MKGIEGCGVGISWRHCVVQRGEEWPVACWLTVRFLSDNRPRLSWGDELGSVSEVWDLRYHGRSPGGDTRSPLNCLTTKPGVRLSLPIRAAPTATAAKAP